MKDAKTELIKIAQSMIQKVGYNDFSYRDIAEKAGIKSASIHYHFPTKADLGRAVAENYKNEFMAALDHAKDKNDQPDALLNAFVTLFRATLQDDRKMCLCGMLSAESQSLPDKVIHEIKLFFNDCLAWLETVFTRLDNSGNDIANECKVFMATLEGGLIIAKGLGDVTVFDKIAEAALQKYFKT